MLIIGSVEFLNAKPLNYGFLESVPHDFDFILDTPSNLAVMLKENIIEVGLIPVMEYLNGVGKYVIGNCAIASRGPVGSVLLLRLKDTFDFDRILVDVRSRSSAALLKILLLEKGNSINSICYFNPKTTYLSWARSDAKLIIGDQALFYKKDDKTIDLGEWWFNYTGLPFVFAVWVSNQKLSPEQINTFMESKRLGLENLDKIITDNIIPSRLSEETLRDYYNNRLVFDLGEQEIAGIRKFQELLLKHKLIKEKRDFEIV